MAFALRNEEDQTSAPAPGILTKMFLRVAVPESRIPARNCRADIRAVGARFRQERGRRARPATAHDRGAERQRLDTSVPRRMPPSRMIGTRPVDSFRNARQCRDRGLNAVERAAPWLEI